MFVYAVAFLLPILAIQADEDPCRCYPSQMSGETFFHGRKLNSFSVDYNANKIVENWDGKMRTQYMIFDLNAMERYRILSNGNCNKYAVSHTGNYAQCVPDDAEMTSEKDGLITYEFKLDDVDVVKTVNAESCLPHEISKKRANRVVVLTFNAEANDDHIDAMPDYDLSKCVQH